MDEIFRTFEASIDSVVEGERAVVARINTAGVDRLKTVIDPLGCDVSHFNKTRSVLWNHGRDPIRGTVPIGQGWVKVRRSEGDMIGKASFGKDEFSDLCFQGCKDGTLRGWSIRGWVHDASPPTKEEIRSRPDLADCKMVYRKWDLIEFSLTPTPGNSDCLTMLISRGLITAPEGFVATEKVSRYITHSGNKWIVHAEDGKVLGEHPSKEEAEKQLAAIEAHKHDKERAIHTEPYIESDGKLWTVYRADGQPCMALPDPEMADDCLRILLAKPPADRRSPYATEAEQIMAETRRMFGGISAEVKEYIDLYRYGRV